MALLDEDSEPEQDEKQEEQEQEVQEETQFDFVLEYDSFPVNITDPKTGEVSEFELREMPGNKRDAFMNRMRGKVNKDGTVKDYTDVQADLLAMVMYPKGAETPVTIGAIRKFPAKMLDKLYTKAVHMNALNKEAELQAKKT